MQEMPFEATLCFCIGNILVGFVWISNPFYDRISGKYEMDFSHWSEIAEFPSWGRSGRVRGIRVVIGKGQGITYPCRFFGSERGVLRLPCLAPLFLH